MQNTAVRPDEAPLPLRLRGPELVEENGLEHALTCDPHISPARALQQRLLREYLISETPAPAQVRRFPGAVRLAIIFGGTMLIWVPLFGLTQVITTALSR